MNYRALAVGAALGFLFALSPSCSPGGGDCNATNCAGCCDADKKCQAQSAATCGASGNACVACAAGQTCTGGVCGGGAGGGGGTTQTCQQQGLCPKTSGGCGVDVCTNGCCVPNSPTGACSTTPAASLCGANGNTCTACAAGVQCVATTGGSMCGSGGGTGSTDAGIGTPCADSSECGPGFFCKTMTNQLTDGGTYTTKPDGGAVVGVPYQDGYCTKRCTAPSQCGAGNTCLNFASVPGGVNGEIERLCVKTCDTSLDPSDCRPGYSCLPTSSTGTAGMCFVDPDYPTGVVGSACSTFTDCGDNWSSSCIPAANGAGNETGFPGGYCTADCGQNIKRETPSNSYCGAKAFCVTFSGGDAQCFERCGSLDGGAVGETSGRGTCTRPVHVCWGGFQDPLLGMCVGDCRQQPSSCAAGKSCVNDGGINQGFCCSTAADGGNECTAAGFQ